MPASRVYRGSLSEEEKKQLAVALAEAKNRGIKVDTKSAESKIKIIWPVDNNGYFIKNNGKFFNATPPQKDFIHSRASFSGLISGRGGGKTSSGAQKALLKIKISYLK